MTTVIYMKPTNVLIFLFENILYTLQVFENKAPNIKDNPTVKHMIRTC